MPTFIRVFFTSIYFFTQVAFLYANETNLWSERKRVVEREKPIQLASLPASSPATAKTGSLVGSLPLQKDLSLRASFRQPKIGALPKVFAPLLNNIPTSAASVRDIVINKQDKEAPLVALVQDVHMNSEAQHNISAVLTSLNNQVSKNADTITVGLEAAFAPLDVTRPRLFKDARLISTVSDEFLNKDQITAPGHAALVVPTLSMNLVGVDDPTHYRQNVLAYQASQRQLPLVKTSLDALEKELLSKKRLGMNKALMDFDNHRVSYEKGSLSFGEYAVWLNATAERVGLIEDADVFSLQPFLAAYQIEKNLNLKRVEVERTRIVEKIAAKITKPELQELIDGNLAYQAGALTYGDYYRHIRDLIHRHSIDLASTPAFDHYVRYVLLADNLNVEKILDAAHNVELSVEKSLCKTPQDLTLAKKSRALGLAQKIITFALTPNEWKQYQQTQPALQADLARARIDLTSFEDFYREADARSERMVENLMAAMRLQRGRLKASVLVAGGFHTPDIKERLLRAGASVAVVQPRIIKINDGTGSEYLSVFTREKTPLDQLFSGEKLFLASADQVRGATSDFIPAVLGAGSFFEGKTIPSAAGVVVSGNASSADVVVTTPAGEQSFHADKTAVASEVDASVLRLPSGLVRFSKNSGAAAFRSLFLLIPATIASVWMSSMMPLLGAVLFVLVVVGVPDSQSPSRRPGSVTLYGVFGGIFDWFKESEGNELSDTEKQVVRKAMNDAMADLNKQSQTRLDELTHQPNLNVIDYAQEKGWKSRNPNLKEALEYLIASNIPDPVLRKKAASEIKRQASPFLALFRDTGKQYLMSRWSSYLYGYAPSQADLARFRFLLRAGANVLRYLNPLRLSELFYDRATNQQYLQSAVGSAFASGSYEKTKNALDEIWYLPAQEKSSASSRTDYFPQVKRPKGYGLMTSRELNVLFTAYNALRNSVPDNAANAGLRRKIADQLLILYEAAEATIRTRTTAPSTTALNQAIAARSRVTLDALVKQHGGFTNSQVVLLHDAYMDLLAQASTNSERTALKDSLNELFRAQYDNNDLTPFVTDARISGVYATVLATPLQEYVAALRADSIPRAAKASAVMSERGDDMRFAIHHLENLMAQKMAHGALYQSLAAIWTDVEYLANYVKSNPNDPVSKQLLAQLTGLYPKAEVPIIVYGPEEVFESSYASTLSRNTKGTGTAAVVAVTDLTAIASALGLTRQERDTISRILGDTDNKIWSGSYGEDESRFNKSMQDPKIAEEINKVLYPFDRVREGSADIAFVEKVATRARARAVEVLERGMRELPGDFGVAIDLLGYHVRSSNPIASSSAFRELVRQSMSIVGGEAADSQHVLLARLKYMLLTNGSEDDLKLALSQIRAYQRSKEAKLNDAFIDQLRALTDVLGKNNFKLRNVLVEVQKIVNDRSTDIAPRRRNEKVNQILFNLQGVLNRSRILVLSGNTMFGGQLDDLVAGDTSVHAFNRMLDGNPVASVESIVRGIKAKSEIVEKKLSEETDAQKIGHLESLQASLGRLLEQATTLRQQLSERDAKSFHELSLDYETPTLNGRDLSKGPNDLKLLLDYTSLFERFLFGTQQLEDLHSYSHQLFDAAVKGMNVMTAVREARDSRTDPVADLYLALGDCRHHAFVQQLFFDLKRAAELQGVWSKAYDRAQKGEDITALLEKYERISNVQMFVMDAVVKAQWQMDSLYQPHLVNGDKVYSHTLQNVEEHTLNVLLIMGKNAEGDSIIQQAYWADTFYHGEGKEQAEYKWRFRKIPGINNIRQTQFLKMIGTPDYLSHDIKQIKDAAGDDSLDFDSIRQTLEASPIKDLLKTAGMYDKLQQAVSARDADALLATLNEMIGMPSLFVGVDDIFASIDVGARVAFLDVYENARALLKRVGQLRQKSLDTMGPYDKGYLILLNRALLDVFFYGVLSPQSSGLPAGSARIRIDTASDVSDDFALADDGESNMYAEAAIFAQNTWYAGTRTHANFYNVAGNQRYMVRGMSVIGPKEDPLESMINFQNQYHDSVYQWVIDFYDSKNLAASIQAALGKDKDTSAMFRIDYVLFQTVAKIFSSEGIPLAALKLIQGRIDEIKQADPAISTYDLFVQLMGEIASEDPRSLGSAIRPLAAQEVVFAPMTEDPIRTLSTTNFSAFFGLPMIAFLRGADHSYWAGSATITGVLAMIVGIYIMSKLIPLMRAAGGRWRTDRSSRDNVRKQVSILRDSWSKQGVQSESEMGTILEKLLILEPVGVGDLTPRTALRTAIQGSLSTETSRDAIAEKMALLELLNKKSESEVFIPAQPGSETNLRYREFVVRVLHDKAKMADVVQMTRQPAYRDSQIVCVVAKGFDVTDAPANVQFVFSDTNVAEQIVAQSQGRKNMSIIVDNNAMSASVRGLVEDLQQRGYNAELFLLIEAATPVLVRMSIGEMVEFEKKKQDYIALMA